MAFSNQSFKSLETTKAVHQTTKVATETTIPHPQTPNVATETTKAVYQTTNVADETTKPSKKVNRSALFVEARTHYSSKTHRFGQISQNPQTPKVAGETTKAHPRTTIAAAETTIPYPQTTNVATETPKAVCQKTKASKKSKPQCFIC